MGKEASMTVSEYYYYVWPVLWAHGKGIYTVFALSGRKDHTYRPYERLVGRYFSGCNRHRYSLFEKETRNKYNVAIGGVLCFFKKFLIKTRASSIGGWRIWRHWNKSLWVGAFHYIRSRVLFWPRSNSLCWTYCKLEIIFFLEEDNATFKQLCSNIGHL